MDLREADDLLFAVIEEHGTAVFSTHSATAYPQTYRAMFSFFAKLNMLKTGVLDLLDVQNPYALNVLFRCLCEHYLKFMYVFVRFAREQSDGVGVEYFTFCGAVEMRDYASALAVAEGLVGHSALTDIDDLLKERYPRAAELSKRQLDEASGQFKYRSILRFLAREAPRVSGPDSVFLPSIVPAYARLSSFVHGGPGTDAEMASAGSLEKAVDECQERARLAVLMGASAFLFTAMAVTREFPKTIDVVAKTNAALNEVLAQWK